MEDIIKGLVLTVFIAWLFVRRSAGKKKPRRQKAVVPQAGRKEGRVEFPAERFAGKQAAQGKPEKNKPKRERKNREVPVAPCPHGVEKVPANPPAGDGIRLKTRTDARRAFIYSEIFNRKY